MINKHLKTLFLLIAISFVTFQNVYAASTIYEQSGDFYVSSLQVSSDGSSYTIELTPYSVERAEWGTYTDSTFQTTKTFKIIDASDLGSQYIVRQDFNCKSTYYKIVYFDASGSQIGTLKFLSGTDISGSKCGSTDADGGSGAGTDCPGCEMFDCPGWDEYMSKLDEIKSAIPPAPDWNEVAGIFTNTIVPRMINDLGDLLGSAPAAPSIPAQLGGVNDGGIDNDVPQMLDVPGLGDSGFDAGKIKREAPVIMEREDPTGGFDLIKDPLSTLPELPGDSFPKPGQTDAGDWGENKPLEPSNPYPMKPIESDVDAGGAPKPGSTEVIPPTPGEDGSTTTPIPGDDGVSAPTPGGDATMPGMKDYKPGPESEDGSGGELNP